MALHALGNEDDRGTRKDERSWWVYLLQADRDQGQANDLDSDDPELKSV